MPWCKQKLSLLPYKKNETNLNCFLFIHIMKNSIGMNFFAKNSPISKTGLALQEISAVFDPNDGKSDTSYWEYQENQKDKKNPTFTPKPLQKLH